MNLNLSEIMRTVGVFVLSICIGNITFAQADTPCGAPILTLGSSCMYVTHDASMDTKGTIGGTPSCGLYSSTLAEEDTWYSFIAPAGGSVVISTSQTSGSAYPYASAAVYSGPCTGLVEIDCFNGYGGVAYPSFNLIGLTPGQSYFVRFWGLLPTAGLPKTHDFCAWAPPSPPINDECDDAIPFDANPGPWCDLFVSGTLDGATQSPESYYCNFAGGGSSANDDVWFSFVAQNSTQYVQLNNVVGSSTNLSYSVHVSTFCNTTGVNAIGCNNVVNGLTVGQTYYIRVWSNSNTPQNTTFDLCVTSPPVQPSCAVNPLAGNTACTATPICNLDGYCGTTSSTYSADSWPELFNEAASCFPDIDNNSFLELTASATEISFYVWVENCNFPNGIQIMVFSADSCNNGPVTNHACWSPGFVPVAPTLISASGLTIGETYYIMIDGNAGAICDYTIAAHEGFQIGVEVQSVSGDTSICSGQSIDLYAIGGFGNYSWSPATGLNTTTGDTVTSTPTSPGLITYSVTTLNPNPICPNDTGEFNLLATPFVTGVDMQNACGSYTWIDGVTYTTNNNTATDTLFGAASGGCDSIVTLDLTIVNNVSGTDVQSACVSYTWIDGVTYTGNNNTATDTLFGAASNGCDSIVTLDLTITNAVLSTDIQSACVSYTWIDGVTYTGNNNTATDTLFGAASNGCDSIVTLDLTITNAVSSTDIQTACIAYTWIDGVTYTSSNNTATDTLFGAASNGCDSIVTLDLTITNAVSSTDIQTACIAYTWIDGVTYTSSNNIATDTLFGAASNGCDSIVTLDLTITNAVSSTDIQTACISYTWIDGVTYTNSNNTATDTLFGASVNGCDSIVFLDLTITSFVTSTDIQTACISYTWIDGITYTNSNATATDTLFGAAVGGCDSIVFLDLTIENSVSGTDIQTACVSYTWIDGMTYTSSNNTATDTLFGVSVNGCDSIVFLDLTIINSVTGTDVQMACDSYTWIDGVMYTSSTNLPTDTLFGSSINGCDSIVNLNLTIINTPSVNPMATVDTILLGNEVMLSVIDSGFNYEWSNGAIGSFTLVSPTETMTFNVVASNGICSDTGYLEIVVLDEELNLLIPTAFSPNGDGINDLFRVVNSDDFTDIEMQIYNRWGELIFNGIDNSHPWDGTYKSKPQNIDVYIYSIEATAVKDGKVYSIVGNVSLIR